MCVTYGVEHETAVSVESDLPFILMGFVLFVLGGLIYFKIKVNMKEPGPGIKFKKRGKWVGRGCVPDICACTAKTARRKTL